MFKRKKIWLAFESEPGFPNKAKPYNLSDIEHFAEQTNHSIESEPEWVDELFEIQERLDDGSLLALHEVIDACDEAQICLPKWAAKELQRLVISTITNEPFEKRERGRANSNTAKMREELKHYIRKGAVEGVRRYQALEPCLFAFLFLPLRLRKLHEGKALPDLGRTMTDAIQYASLALRGTFAQASEETIRKAYFSSAELGWGPWVFSRSSSLEAVGLHETNSLVLPEGVGTATLDTEDEAALPIDIYSGSIDATLKLDSVSAAYVKETQKYEYIDDFIEVERKRRRSINS